VRARAGIAENITKFLANLAFAPVLGALQAVKTASGYNAEEHGSGLLGMLFSGGSSGSSAPAAGMPNVTPGGSIPTGVPSGAPQAISPANIPQSQFDDTNLVPAAAQLNDVIAAYFPQVQSIGGYRQDPHPDHPSGRALDIMIPGGTTRGGANPQGKALGDQMWDFLMSTGIVDPTGSLWQTDTGGDHFDHIHARIAEGMENAAVSSGLIPGAGAPGGFQQVGSTPFGSIPIPLPVTIVGGGAGGGLGLPGAGGGAPAGTPASGEGLGLPPGPGGLAASLYQDAEGRWRSRLPGWDQLIQRESSGINQRQGITDANSGGNEAEGLFQITPQTWAGHGGTRYAPSALAATPQEQANIAAEIFRANPTGSDWGMGLPGRESPTQLGAELAGAPGLPASLPGGGSTLPGAGMPQGLMANLGVGGPAAPSQSVMGGRQLGAGLPASGGVGFNGGIIGAAASMAASAAAGAGSFGAGGGAAGAASDIAMQLIGRAIGAGGQYAGNVAMGLLETFSLNDSALADPGKSWLGRLGFAAVGMRPALPNIAGMMGGEPNPNMAEGGKKPPPPGLTPQQAEAAKAGDQKGKGDVKNTFNTTVNNQRATEDGTGRDIQRHLGATTMAGAGMGSGG
jgi:hypothetical protein